jgi:hypothetical protein
MSRVIRRTTAAMAALILAAPACTGPATPTSTSAVESMDALTASGPDASNGQVVLSIPDEDPGPPFYARVGYQYLHDGGLLAIPFYRSPACIPADFNLLEFFHFPTGPTDPAAFACPLQMTGRLLIEPDAAPGTFPRQVVLQGDAVPIWFIPLLDFQAAADDGEVTMAQLAALSPVKGTASRFHETLHPREDEHRIIIDARGTLEDGRTFRFHATHIDDAARVIRINIR